MTDSKTSRIALLNVEFESAVVDPEPVYADDEIGPGKTVTLHFALLLENGVHVDSNFDKEPVSFTVGDGNLLPGFEQVLMGLKAGNEGEFLLTPEAAFGVGNEDNIQRFPRYQFPPDLNLVPGLMINFADSAGNNQAGVVKQFDSAWVEVDFNHPLAGLVIRFKFHIHDVQLSQASTTQ
ncbi:MAG: peptidylprolyl isomerase [Pseudomonadota bacterium]